MPEVPLQDSEKQTPPARSIGRLAKARLIAITAIIASAITTAFQDRITEVTSLFLPDATRIACHVTAPFEKGGKTENFNLLILDFVGEKGRDFAANLREEVRRKFNISQVRTCRTLSIPETGEIPVDTFIHANVLADKLDADAVVFGRTHRDGSSDVWIAPRGELDNFQPYTVSNADIPSFVDFSLLLNIEPLPDMPLHTALISGDRRGYDWRVLGDKLWDLGQRTNSINTRAAGAYVAANAADKMNDAELGQRTRIWIETRLEIDPTLTEGMTDHTWGWLLRAYFLSAGAERNCVAANSAAKTAKQLVKAKLGTAQEGDARSEIASLNKHAKDSLKKACPVDR